MRDQEKVLVEQTAKKYKLVDALAVGVMVPACLGVWASLVAESRLGLSISVAALSASVVAMIVNAVRVWWHHG